MSSATLPVVEGDAALADTRCLHLCRLETLGFVRSYWESEKVARREQRPARRYYEITKTGTADLAVAMKRFANLGRLPAPRHA